MGRIRLEARGAGGWCFLLPRRGLNCWTWIQDHFETPLTSDLTCLLYLLVLSRE